MIIEAYESLAEAIIVQAVKDYRTVLGKLRYYRNDRTALAEKRQIERFFRSGWFAVLTDLDGEVLIEKIKQESAHLEVAI